MVEKFILGGVVGVIALIIFLLMWAVITSANSTQPQTVYVIYEDASVVCYQVTSGTGKDGQWYGGSQQCFVVSR